MQITPTAKAWTLLALSVVLGGISAWAIDRHLDHKTLEIKRIERGDQVRRLVAAHSIDAGAILQISDLAVREIPARWADPESLGPEDAARVVGMLATAALSAGQPILSAHVTPRSDPGLATRLAAGKRAVTIPVDQVSSLSGLLNPGDRIDLFVSFDHRGRRMTAPLMSEVQVLATGRQVTQNTDSAGAGASDYGTVTLETTPAQAVKLIAARQSGSITAVLSGSAGLEPAGSGDNVSPRRAGHLAGLLGFDRPDAPAPVPVIYGDRLLASEPEIGVHDVLAGGELPAGQVR